MIFWCSWISPSFSIITDFSLTHSSTPWIPTPQNTHVSHYKKIFMDTLEYQSLFTAFRPLRAVKFLRHTLWPALANMLTLMVEQALQARCKSWANTNMYVTLWVSHGFSRLRCLFWQVFETPRCVLYYISDLQVCWIKFFNDVRIITKWTFDMIRGLDSLVFRGKQKQIC